MLYNFDVSYPKDNTKLGQIQNTVFQRFPQSKYKNIYIRKIDKNYHTTIYQTTDPEALVRIAKVLKNTTPQIFITVVSVDGEDIYYHPIELALIDPNVKKHYMNLLKSLSEPERIVHDYLVNLYGIS